MTSLQQQSARERAALWLAVNKLDVLEAAKDAAIKELQVCALGTCIVGSGFLTALTRTWRLVAVEEDFCWASLSWHCLNPTESWMLLLALRPTNRKPFLWWI